MAEYLTTPIFSYGAIPIERNELKDVNFSTSLEYVTSNRVGYTPKVNTNFGTLDPIEITLELALTSTKLKVWRDYYNGLPVGVLQSLVLGLDTYNFIVLKSIEADFSRYIYKNSVERITLIDTTIKFLWAR